MWSIWHTKRLQKRVNQLIYRYGLQQKRFTEFCQPQKAVYSQVYMASLHLKR
nr:MAG TPA: hypothetical protein [Caudoviricetes sp.]